MQTEDKLRELSESIKCNNICTMELQEGAEKLPEEIIAENVPDLEKKQISRFRRHRELHSKPTKNRPTKTYCD